MSEEIRVYVIDKGRKYLYLMYTDPATGKRSERSAKTSKQSVAEKAAGVWQDELRNGRYQKPSRVTWEAFRENWATNALPAVAATSATTYEATLNVFERLCSPQKLADVTTAFLSGFATKLRNEGKAEATVARHLRGLRVCLRWAQREGLLNKLPAFNMPKRVKGAKAMRGRAVTGEEFDRMIEVVPKVVENTAAKSWEFYLRGLWASGLRLSESLTLRWDNAPEAIVVDLSGRRPMFRIPAEVEKGNRDRLLPMTPDFAALLQSVPESERRGRVFRLLNTDGTLLPATRRAVGPVCSAIGKAAGIVVDERKKKGEVVRKFASAHDLRRAFGLRWSSKLMPADLQKLMRHESIETTMRFYVGQDAEAVADAIWATVDSLVDTPTQAGAEQSKNTVNSNGDDRS